MNAGITRLEGSDSHWKIRINWIWDICHWDRWKKKQGCWKSEDLGVTTRKTGLEGSNIHQKTRISQIWEAFPWDGQELSSVCDKIPSPLKLPPPPKRIPLHENTQRRIQDPSKTWETPPSPKTS